MRIRALSPGEYGWFTRLAAWLLKRENGGVELRYGGYDPRRFGQRRELVDHGPQVRQFLPSGVAPTAADCTATASSRAHQVLEGNVLLYPIGDPSPCPLGQDSRHRRR